jgi:hypothetical protein
VPKEKLKLFVWEDFSPNYTAGLAFAIAHTTEEAMAKVIESRGYEVYHWGILTIHPLDTVYANSVSGGG